MSTQKKVVTKKRTVKKKKVSAVKKKNVAVKKKSNENETSLILNTVQVINEAATLRESLKRLSEEKQTVTIDASQVEMIDTAAFQLLIAFVVTMNKKSQKFIWKDPSKEFLERASLLDLTAVLCLGGAKV